MPDGRVATRHLGSGPLAALAAALDAEARSVGAAERAARREQQRAGRERLDRVDAELGRIVRDALGVAVAALEAAGYHRHARGAWRRRRTTVKLDPARLAQPPARLPAATGHFDRMMDIGAMACALKRAGLEADSEHWGAFDDELRATAAELAGPDPTPAMRMLGDTAALTWFLLRQCEATDQHRRIDRLNRQLVRTLKAIATLRRLAVPAVNVVNVNVSARERGTMERTTPTVVEAIEGDRP